MGGVAYAPMPNNVDEILRDDAYLDSGRINTFLVEMWASFLFCLTYLIVTSKKASHTQDSAINGAAISFALFACLAMMNNVSGGCLNPANVIALNMMSRISYRNYNVMKFIWIYMFGALLGAIMAGVFYGFLHVPTILEVEHHIRENKHHGETEVVETIVETTHDVVHHETELPTIHHEEVVHHDTHHVDTHVVDTHHVVEDVHHVPTHTDTYVTSTHHDVY